MDTLGAIYTTSSGTRSGVVNINTVKTQIPVKLTFKTISKLQIKLYLKCLKHFSIDINISVCSCRRRVVKNEIKTK